MHHLEVIAVMACVAYGAWVAMGDGMVLHWLSKAFERLPAFIQKPLHTCPRCMVSAWGIPAAIFIGANPWLLPVYVLGAAGLQELFDR